MIIGVDVLLHLEIPVINTIVESKQFSLQLDESTYISGKAQLIAFTRFFEDNEILKKILCCESIRKNYNEKRCF